MSSVQTLLLCLCLTLSFASCSSDDSDSSSTSDGSSRADGTWYMDDASLYSFLTEARAAYKKDSLSYYNYVKDDGTISRVGTSSAIQIINGNTLKYWYFNCGMMGCEASLKSEYYMPTNYTLGPDEIIWYSTSSAMYTYVEAEGKIIVTNGDIYTITSKGLIRDGGTTPLRKTSVNTADFTEQKQIIRDCKNKSNTTLTTDCDFDNYLCYVTFKSSLKNLHPNTPFVYGLEYGLRYNTLDVFETEKSSFEGNVMIDGYGYDSIFGGSLAALEEKLKNGQELTTHEKMLYNELTKNIEDQRTKAKQYFTVKSYVRYGGIKYYIN